MARPPPWDLQQRLNLAWVLPAWFRVAWFFGWFAVAAALWTKHNQPRHNFVVRNAATWQIPDKGAKAKLGFSQSKKNSPQGRL